MPPKRKPDHAALSARKEPRLEEELRTIIEVDSDGDLHLAVKDTNLAEHEEPAVFLVDRKILSLSSPVFKAMLGRDSRFMEGQSNSPTDISKVTVEDESIKAVEIILHAIHLQGHLVPETVSYSLLRHLAIVCDKYDLRKSLGTWPETWVKSHTEKMEQPRNESLFIAIAFKLDAIFPKITKTLILGTWTLDDGTMVTIHNQVIGEDIPEVILDQIKSVRMEAIMAIENRLWTLQQPIQNVETACRYPNVEESDSDNDDGHKGPELCQLLQLGILKRKLFYLEHPHNESPFRKKSLLSIISDVDDVRCTMPEALRTHQRCLKAAGMYTYTSKRLAEIQGLRFDKSWNLHHGKFPARN